MAPLGAFYAPAFAAGTRAGVAELAPLLIGADPREPGARGGRSTTSCSASRSSSRRSTWRVYDLAAQAAGVPLCSYLGGRYGTAVDLYRSVSQAAPEAMARSAAAYVAAGYRRIQVKVGADPAEDVERVTAVRAAVDSGRRDLLRCQRRVDDRRRRARSCATTRDLEITLEQPCMTYDDCRAMRQHCPHPLVLDECIDSLPALLTASATASPTA